MSARTVALWAGPRNGSTALMYSFAQRADTRVMDEPLFGHFLATTGVDRPSREDVLRTMPLTAQDALASVAPQPMDQVVFLKHCLLYTSPSPRDRSLSRMPSSA